jgi:hypothetical protein
MTVNVLVSEVVHRLSAGAVVSVRNKCYIHRFSIVVALVSTRSHACQAETCSNYASMTVLPAL